MVARTRKAAAGPLHSTTGYNPAAMMSCARPWAAIALLAVVCAVAAAQTYIPELRATARVLPGVGPGVTAIKRAADGRLHVLLSIPGGGGSVVRIFDAAGDPAGQIPADGAPRISFASDFDLDGAGRVYVADRGANAVKIYSREGLLDRDVPIAGPVSVAALPAGEIAVSTLRPERLVRVYDANRRLVREFGELTEVTEREDINRIVHSGRLLTDPAHHLYYAFTYLPEPTLRKYDRFGYALTYIELSTIEFLNSARVARREIERHGDRPGVPPLRTVIRAAAVDPETQQIWLAIGNELLLFTADGVRRSTYRIYTPEGVRLEPVALVIEPDRILVAADPLGIYEFARPDKAVTK